jgi:hypothetical protein
MVREVHEEGCGQTRTWFCAILTAVCCPIQTSVALGWTSARCCCCLALAGSREEAGAGGFRAESTPRIDVHEVVVVEQGHCRYRRGTVWEKEGGRMFGAHLSSASVLSSAGKLSAGGGAFPKKDQGWRLFVSSG